LALLTVSHGNSARAGGPAPLDRFSALAALAEVADRSAAGCSVSGTVFAVPGSAGLVSAMPGSYDDAPVSQHSARAHIAEAPGVATGYLAGVEVPHLHVGETNHVRV
jgi:hypothetical protein